MFDFAQIIKYLRQKTKIRFLHKVIKFHTKDKKIYIKHLELYTKS